MLFNLLSYLLIIGCGDNEIVNKTTEQDGNIILDEDGDTFFSDEDCDDSNPNIYPNAEEVCDGIDNDCDDVIDEDVLTIYYQDLDGDGFGNAENIDESCSMPDGFSATGTDCDDNEPLSYPGFDEVCDNIDNDCNGQTDEGVGTLFFEDLDGDGYGNEDIPTLSCEDQVWLAETSGDCDDSDDRIHPDADEFCDDIDNDCNGQTDEDTAVDAVTFYLDMDEDGFGNSEFTLIQCNTPENYTVQSGDCVDSDPNIHPNSTEICDENAQDEDCDGLINDEDDSTDVNTMSVWFADVDEDGFGNLEDTIQNCDLPEGRTSNSTDCDDENVDINPDADEICDEIDNDCDELIDDADEDTLDSTKITWYMDEDEDGYGDVLDSIIACATNEQRVINNEDCDDGNIEINPDANEICDEIDNDCDDLIDDDDSSLDETTTTEFFFDLDEDGYGNDVLFLLLCDSDSLVANSDDCDDSDPNTVNDMDCDGILTDNDCDDNDENNNYLKSEDADCDGVLTIDDCDDNNANDILLSGDCDEDGIATEIDCDDTIYNPENDTNCDGISQPMLSILSPSFNEHFQNGSEINFSAMIYDVESPELASVWWESNIDGVFDLTSPQSDGSLEVITSDLSGGAHVISLEVSHPNGYTDDISFTISINSRPDLPIIESSHDAPNPNEDLVVSATSSDLEDGDNLIFTFNWYDEQDNLLHTITSTSNSSIYPYELSEEDALRVEVIATDQEGLDSLTAQLEIVGCSDFATEIPYDGIDSNCDGLEFLNDLNEDGIPDWASQNFDSDNDIIATVHPDYSITEPVMPVAASLGVECYGKKYTHSDGSQFYLTMCDNDLYWTEAHHFCLDNGYDGLMSFKDAEEFQILTEHLEEHKSFEQSGSRLRDDAWLGFTRGTNCGPLNDTSTGLYSICGQDIRNYYWTDGSDTSHIEDDLALYWHPNELNYIDELFGDYSTHNSVEHCVVLISTQNNSVDGGLHDLYCGRVQGSSAHDLWSFTHTRAAGCMKRFDN